MSARDQQFLGREARDDFVAGLGDDDFFLDTRGAPAISRGPESFQRKHHSWLDFAGVIERHETADYRLLPDGEADAVTVLQREAGFLVRETEFLRLRPHGGNLSRGAPRA